MLAFLGLTLAVLVATLGLAHWSFERGFLDYVNALEQTRLQRLSNGVSKLYVANNEDWRLVDQLTLNRRLSPSGDAGFQPPPMGGMVGGKFPPPPPRDRRSEGRPPPNKDFERQPPDQFQGDRPRRPPPRKRVGQDGKKDKPAGSLLPHLAPPTALFDMQGERVAGLVLSKGDIEIIEVPVVVDGETVGVLKSELRRNFDSPIETAFSRQQSITSWVIGIASLLLAALVSWFLTRLLLAPVRRIIGGIQQLSAGDYTQTLVGGQDEYGRLMDDINHLSNTLQKNQSSRRRWLADISHELRTPLSILTGEIEALKDGVRPFNGEQLASLDQEVQRLRFLTDDLYQLSLSDIGGLRYEFVPIDFAESIKCVVKDYQSAAEELDITLSFAASKAIQINADQSRLAQLLANLLRNSLAYTNPGGVITLSLKREHNKAILQIHDTPPGVTQEECDQLFEPLYRQDESRSRRSEGAGLGLAICRNIVEAHRGTITAAPSPLGGLEVTMTLPVWES